MVEITNIQQICDLAKAGVSNWKDYGNVAVKTNGNLLLFNYTPEAQFENRWNYFESVSRGLIIDQNTGEIVARPFDKFFNWMENGRLVLSARCFGKNRKLYLTFTIFVRILNHTI